MASEKSANVQDVFLNTIRKKHMSVTIFLSSGVKLQGNVTAFDNFSILLRRNSQLQLVYKHAIATIVPAGDIVLEQEDGVSVAAASAA
jgi:host factor-I protein